MCEHTTKGTWATCRNKWFGKLIIWIRIIIMICMMCPVQSCWQRSLIEEGIHPHPGPKGGSKLKVQVQSEYLTVLTNNLGTIRTRWAQLINSKVHIAAFQETKLTQYDQAVMAAQLREAGWHFHPGKPMPEVKTTDKRAAVGKYGNYTVNGGVAIMSKDIKLTQPWWDAIANALYDTGRWTEVAYPITGTNAYIYIATIWGHSGASGRKSNSLGGQIYVENERFLTQVMLRATMMGAVPYVVVGDFNINLSESEVLSKAMGTGWWKDAAVLMGWEEIPPTFCRNGTYPGMKGKGITRIDACMLNQTAAQAFHQIRYEYDWPGMGKDHVPILLELKFRSI